MTELLQPVGGAETRWARTEDDDPRHAVLTPDARGR
jgi:hypothetical protein